MVREVVLDMRRQRLSHRTRHPSLVLQYSSEVESAEGAAPTSTTRMTMPLPLMVRRFSLQTGAWEANVAGLVEVKISAMSLM